MADNVSSIVRKALANLNSEKARLDRQIAALEGALGGLDGRARRGAAPRRRRKMSAAARKAIGVRMKAYWAKRRAKSKSKSK